MLAQRAIAHLKHRAPHRLSGGEKKRVALASVLIVAPEVLLLDEPTASLEPQSQAEVVRLMIARRHSGRTIVTAAHDSHLVYDVADYVYVLEGGKVAGAGTPDEILADHALLQRTNLANAHWHVHADGKIHVHAHGHRREHHRPSADECERG